MLKISSINDWLHYSYASGLIRYSTLFLFTSDRSHRFYFFYQVGVPGHIYTLQSWFCWHGTSSTLAIVDKMVRYRPLALQLLKGLPKSSRVAALLEAPTTAKDTLLDFLMIISDLARMSKVCCFLAYWHLFYMTWKDVMLWCQNIVGYIDWHFYTLWLCPGLLWTH